MKKLLLAVSFALSATAAQADVYTTANGFLSVDYNPTPVVFVGTNDVVNLQWGYNGQLLANSDAFFNVTFIGKEAGDTNFYLSNGGVVTGSGTDVITPGTTKYFAVAAGVIDFGFTGTGGAVASNTGLNISRIAYLANDINAIDPTTGLPFEFLIGFNDGGSVDGDFDDYVIGVSATAVPVPAALPLMASALGMFGIARRRKSVA